jgi:DNA replication and repair protein RecF
MNGQAQFGIRGEFVVNGNSHEVACSYKSGSKKVIRVDGNDTPRMSEHIGKFPVVMVAPNDIELIWDGSDLRRKFFDSLISQIDKNYLEKLITYNHHLKQRNSLLRAYIDRAVDFDLLDSYNYQLAEAGEFISKRRAVFVKALLPHLQKNYDFIADSKFEGVGIKYKTDSDGDLKQLLTNSIKRDLALQRTSIGIHRDDFIFHLNDYELKRYGSQGQQKSFLIAMKLAEFQMLESEKKLKPLLLLDDIFDKLDDERIHKLVKLVAQQHFGQLFITDARPDRSQALLGEAQIDTELFRVENGRLSHWR